MPSIYKTVSFPTVMFRQDFSAYVKPHDMIEQVEKFHLVFFLLD